MEEYGICPDCKEHCTFEEVCVACGGEGEIIVDEVSIKCTVCDGSGVVEIESV
jgi:DnaJ-class molecular chaperone